MVNERTKYKIKDVFELSAGGDVDRAHFSVYKTNECCYPIYSNSLENCGLYGYTSNPKYKADSVTITGRGSVGHAEYRADKFDAIIRLLVLEPKDNNVCAQFVADYINSCIDFPLESTGVPQLTAPQIMNIELELPQYDEQKEIATLLSDINNLIDTLVKQIQKKKAIKQGAMQELLTGKKRLPGFSGEWQTIPLINALTVGHGMSQHNVESPTGKYPILATGGEIGKATTYLWAKPSVLIGRKGTINKPQYMDRPFWSIDTLFYTRIKEGYYPKFLYYVFCQIDWLNYNEASGVPSLSAKTIESIEVQIPEYAEQIAIADLLSEMDSEIELLEQKLAKYRQLKQGMMQQLLTGKIRLTK